jgi:hypothetical protein
MDLGAGFGHLSSSKGWPAPTRVESSLRSAGDDMTDSEVGSEAAIVLRVEFDGYLTRFDLWEILQGLDELVFKVLVHEELVEPAVGGTQFPFPSFDVTRGRITVGSELLPLTFFQITSMGKGSLLLTGILSGAVAAHVLRKLRTGIRRSGLDAQLERLGEISGDLLARVLGYLNGWAEQYTDKRSNFGDGVIKSVTVKVKRPTKRKPKE